ncbi:hypothetical protein VTK56DRAFT_3294 [Thermocarpiscus australiensis]
MACGGCDGSLYRKYGVRCLCLDAHADGSAACDEDQRRQAQCTCQGFRLMGPLPCCTKGDCRNPPVPSSPMTLAIANRKGGVGKTGFCSIPQCSPSEWRVHLAGRGGVIKRNTLLATRGGFGGLLITAKFARPSSVHSRPRRSLQTWELFCWTGRGHRPVPAPAPRPQSARHPGWDGSADSPSLFACSPVVCRQRGWTLRCRTLAGPSLPHM